MSDFPTTRRYPRSLAEAYPRDHANPIEGFRVYNAGSALAAFLAVLVIIASVWSVIK
jgi:hypothetical protein